MRPRIVAAALAAALAGTLVAAGTATGARPSVRIAFLSGAMANTYVQASYKEMQKVAKQEGVSLTTYEAAFDPQKQYAQIQDAITSKRFQGFVILPLDGVGLVPVVQQAVKAKIAVANLSIAIGTNYSTSRPQVAGQLVSVLDPGTKRGEWISR